VALRIHASAHPRPKFGTGALFSCMKFNGDSRKHAVEECSKEAVAQFMNVPHGSLLKAGGDVSVKVPGCPFEPWNVDESQLGEA
jgi:hypothetical protein